jgi:SulP family sulfate permease
VGNFFSCYPASGSFTSSGVNCSAGAKTPMAANLAALGLTMILLPAAPLAG